MTQIVETLPLVPAGQLHGRRIRHPQSDVQGTGSIQNVEEPGAAEEAASLCVDPPPIPLPRVFPGL
jgi:hypothetical protein